MRHFLDFFGLTPETLIQLEKELEREVKDFLDYKAGKEGKEVSPPECNNNYHCNDTCTCEQCEATSGYLAPADEPNLPDDVEATYTCASTYNEPMYIDADMAVNGWVPVFYNEKPPVWGREIVVPVEKQYVCVSVLNGDTVHVSYEKRIVLDDANAKGSHVVSGVYTYPLPKFADPLTVRAKFVREGILELRFKEKTYPETEDFIAVDID